MAQQIQKVPAPDLGGQGFTLWNMNAEQFNNWRRQNDYPRIVSFFKTNLDQFAEWMNAQQIDDDTLIYLSPSAFLKKETYLYLCDTTKEGAADKTFLSSTAIPVNGKISDNYICKSSRKIVPYYAWFKTKNGINAPEVFVNSYHGRQHYIMGVLELLDIGGGEVRNFIGDRAYRMLDFVNASDLYLQCTVGMRLQFSFSSALNVHIEGTLNFVNAYKTSFGELFQQKGNNLRLANGNFQRWTFEDCSVHIDLSHADLSYWKFTGDDFSITVNNSDIRESAFNTPSVRSPIHWGLYREFHARVKRMYSALGKRKEASNHFYLEKKFEQGSYKYPQANHRTEFFSAKTKSERLGMYTRMYANFAKLCLLDKLWGYGEKPQRVFGISLIVLSLFTLLYCLHPDANCETKHHFWNSVYYSTVTFTTLGYGDIAQHTTFLRVASGFEALLGMSFWGILIAGFTSNAKDY